jgi:hypothetical protein
LVESLSSQMLSKRFIAPLLRSMHIPRSVLHIVCFVQNFRRRDLSFPCRATNIFEGFGELSFSSGFPFFLELSSIDKIPASSCFLADAQYLFTESLEIPSNFRHMASNAPFGSLPLTVHLYLVASLTTIEAFRLGVVTPPRHGKPGQMVYKSRCDPTHIPTV